MGLTDLFSKLIVEHGSAEVQSKHIALFKDQLALADKKISELETENAALKNKLENAETTIQNLTKENDELRSKIQEYELPTEQPTHNNLLDETKINILKLLFKQDKLQVEQIAQALNQHIETIKFHIGDLRTSTMVKRGIGYGSYNKVFDVWSIDQEGRRFLIENNLIT